MSNLASNILENLNIRFFYDFSQKLAKIAENGVLGPPEDEQIG